MPVGSNARVVVEGNSSVIRVYVSAETLYDLEATHRITQSVMALAGHPRCCSGRQLLFQQEEGEFTV